MTCEEYKTACNGHTFKKSTLSFLPWRKEKQLEMFSKEAMGPVKETKKVTRNSPKTKNPPQDLYSNFRP